MSPITTLELAATLFFFARQHVRAFRSKGSKA